MTDEEKTELIHKIKRKERALYKAGIKDGIILLIEIVEIIKSFKPFAENK